MRISDWSSDVCSSDLFTRDLADVQPTFFLGVPRVWEKLMAGITIRMADAGWVKRANYALWMRVGTKIARRSWASGHLKGLDKLRYGLRSEEHTSELQSLMRSAYAVFCLKKKKDE